MNIKDRVIETISYILPTLSTKVSVKGDFWENCNSFSLIVLLLLKPICLRLLAYIIQHLHNETWDLMN